MSKNTETVYDELLFATGVARKDGEDEQGFLKRLWKAVDKLGDDQWEELSEPAQLWANAATEAIEKKNDIPLPDGMNAADVGEDAEEEPAEDADGEEASDGDGEFEEDDDDSEPEQTDLEDAVAAAENEEEEEPAPRVARGKGGKAKVNGAAGAAAPLPDKPAGKKKVAKPERAPKKAVAKAPAKKSATKKASTRKPADDGKPRAPRDGSKREMMINLMSRKKGATMDELTEALGWLPHTTRAAISTQLRQKGIIVDKAQDKARGTIYRIEA